MELTGQETVGELAELVGELESQLADCRDDRKDVEERCARLQDRLEDVADIAIEHGLIHNTPYSRRQFVEGE